MVAKRDVATVNTLSLCA